MLFTPDSGFTRRNPRFDYLLNNAYCVLELELLTMCEKPPVNNSQSLLSCPVGRGRSSTGGLGASLVDVGL